MSNSNSYGMIVNLQDYSVHDGYGIRTLVFMKGCPLHCPWCQNPESIEFHPQIKYRSQLCIECFKCREACSEDAIVENKGRRIDQKKCNLCMQCIEVCPSKALSQVGSLMSVDDIIAAILSYKPFFDASDRGGVTLSGGEPTFQPEFALKLLKTCKEHEIHTAMETCGYAKYDTLRALVSHLDLLLYDVKHMDRVIHEKYTGVSNERILENLMRIVSENDIECVVRVALIHGFNDTKRNVGETARFVSSLGIKRLDLLPFNQLPSGKYRMLGLDWEYKSVKRQEDDVLQRLKGVAERQGLEVTIGGLW